MGVIKQERWSEDNRKRLEAFLEISPEPDDDGRRPVAIFDFDNTVIHGDLGNIVFQDVTSQLCLDPDSQYLKKALAISGDEEKLLRILREAKDGNADGTLFQDSMIQAYFKVYERGGRYLAYPWATQILAGLRAEALRKMGRELAEHELSRPFQMDHKHVEGQEAFVCNRGVKPYPEMIELIRLLLMRSYEVHIVTGTCWIFVEEYLKAAGIEVTKVHGMTLEMAGDVLTHRVRQPPTVGGGKLDVIRQQIGKRPVFVAGDSMSDVAMMLYCSGLCLAMEGEDDEFLSLADEKSWLIQKPFDGPIAKPA